MASLPPFIRRRFLSTTTTTTNVSKKCVVKEVTKFFRVPGGVQGPPVQLRLRGRLAAENGVISCATTPPSALRHCRHVYCKAKYATERFQLLQFAACPFTLRASKLTPYPYNFVLFPRDELKMGMPTYSFSVQTSHLTSMAEEGFDFNACIYNGISYLSIAQESAAKAWIGNPATSSYVMSSSSTHTVADTVFVESIKSRVKHWKGACKNTKKDNALLSSLRKIVMGSEIYGTTPCMNLDVCSKLQVQLALEMLNEFSDELVPLIIPAKLGGCLCCFDKF